MMLSWHPYSQCFWQSCHKYFAYTKLELLLAYWMAKFSYPLKKVESWIQGGTIQRWYFVHVSWLFCGSILLFCVNMGVCVGGGGSYLWNNKATTTKGIIYISCLEMFLMLNNMLVELCFLQWYLRHYCLSFLFFPWTLGWIWNFPDVDV